MSVRSRLDGAGLTRGTLETAAEVAAMGKGEGCVARVGGKKDLVKRIVEDGSVTICIFVSNQIIIII